VSEPKIETVQKPVSPPPLYVRLIWWFGICLIFPLMAYHFRLTEHLDPFPSVTRVPPMAAWDGVFRFVIYLAHFCGTILVKNRRQFDLFLIVLVILVFWNYMLSVQEYGFRA
jgi:hypothetical protein